MENTVHWGSLEKSHFVYFGKFWSELFGRTRIVAALGPLIPTGKMPRIPFVVTLHVAVMPP